jgi:hypothetical protein
MSQQHEDDSIVNSSSNSHINDLIEQRLASPARRGLLKSGLGFASLSFLGAGSAMLAGCGA